MLVQQKFEEAGLVADAEHTHESVTWTMIVLLTLVLPAHTALITRKKQHVKVTLAMKTPLRINIIRQESFRQHSRSDQSDLKYSKLQHAGLLRGRLGYGTKHA